MTFKRSIAALLALCVLVAPAALAATVADSTGGTLAPEVQEEPRADAAAAERRAVRQRAAQRNVRLARTVARLQGDRLGKNYTRWAAQRPLRKLQKHNHRLRVELRGLRREQRWYRAAYSRVPAATLRSIAFCESRNDPRAIGGGGLYRGLFQMTFDIWGAVGGKGDPAAASPAEQYYRAALVYTRYGSGQWPNCGR